ncbi:DnaJ domain-containing protein [Sinomonas albida]|uniref:DnaJ domain-containing protein n=1 Tax=Sinomonas albida TaxID=369942 RepID=UPI0010A82CF2|nr:DnaJ domain-containing protein [Sinomonas albida]
MGAADFYTVLGVDRAATQQEIRRAYRRLVRQLHPDGPDRDRADPAELARVFEAYAVLSHPRRREAYDQALRRAEAALWAQFPRPTRPAWPDESLDDALRAMFRRWLL